MTSERSLEDRAIAAYTRRAMQEGGWRGSVNTPSRPQTTTVDGKRYVVLSNCHGILAVYRVKNDGALKGLISWPAEITKAFA